MKTIIGIALCASLTFTSLVSSGDNSHEEQIERALSAWTHKPAEDVREWSTAMASACITDDECMLLASQAFVESRFMSWVVDQSCNDASWRARQPGWIRRSCDGGHAFGPWQIHDPSLYGAPPDVQARAAVKILRESPKAWTTWRAARSQAQWWHAVAGQ